MRLEEVRRLIQLVEESEIGEVDIWQWWGRIRIRKQGADSPATVPQVTTAHHLAAPAPPAPVAAPSAEAPSGPAADDTAGLVPIKSPMVGTFYRAPAPDAEAYVDPGTSVEPGQTVCIIEAMKLMNEIQSEVRGRVARIVVNDAEAVEFGQTLFLVEEA